MQKWEYKTILRQRGWKATERGEGWSWAGDWNLNITKELEKLGEEGWELVSISPRSGILGVISQTPYHMQRTSPAIQARNYGCLNVPSPNERVVP